MLRKYCIALLPVRKQEQFIFFSKKVTIEKNYQLGNNSLPHVTLCQFTAEETEVNKIWELITNIIENETYFLSFKSFSCMTFDNKIFWLSLMPAEASYLHILQKEINDLLKLSNKRPYDPHLTLLSTTDKNYELKAQPIMKGYKTISDEFVLAIGHCDEIGQFTCAIHQRNPKTSLISKL